MSTTVTDLRNKQLAQKPKDFPGMLKAFLPEIQRALPKHLNGDRMARIALTAFRRTPKLGNCDPRSVFAAVIQASQLGLEPDTLGRSYLVPYGNECQFIPGWKGLVELLNRSGQGTAWTGAVFQGDEFEYMLGDSPYVHHRPAGEYEPEKITHVYAVGRPKGAEWPILEVWKIDRVVKHRDRYNKVGRGHYSYGNLEMYARKVVLLQVLKYMPASPELATAMELDYASDSAGGQHLNVNDAIEGTWAPVPDEVETPPAETTAATGTQAGAADEWPKYENGQWIDSAGQVYDEGQHGWSRENERPAVRADGTFKAKRGTAGNEDPLARYTNAMKAATNLAELDEARELANGPDAALTAEQLAALDGFYKGMAARLGGGQQTGGDFE